MNLISTGALKYNKRLLKKRCSPDVIGIPAGGLGVSPQLPISPRVGG